MSWLLRLAAIALAEAPFLLAVGALIGIHLERRARRQARGGMLHDRGFTIQRGAP